MEKTHLRKLDTSLDELVAAAGQVAFEYSNSDREAYDLTRLALIEIIKKTAESFDPERDFEAAQSHTRYLQ
jgi:hypothetical protein